jgi:hypothetical protein
VFLTHHSISNANKIKTSFIVKKELSTPWSRVLLVKLTLPQLAKKFPAF